MSKQSLQVAVLGILAVCLPSILAYSYRAEMGLFAGIILSTGLLIALGHHWKQGFFEQTQALRYECQDIRAQQALSVITLKAPLPWSSPTLTAITIAQVLFEIRARGCRNIVECGCGISTVYIAWLLRYLGDGKVYAIEHEGPWAALVQAVLDENDLAEHVQIIRAPLRKDTFGNRTVRWYQRSALTDILALPRIDLLMVDGPPQKTDRFARYPALPVFWNQLHRDSVVILDDTRRKAKGSPRGEAKYDNERIPQLWCAEYPVVATQFVHRHGHTMFTQHSKSSESFEFSSSVTTCQDTWHR